jgi:hypothetical protein
MQIVKIQVLTSRKVCFAMVLICKNSSVFTPPYLIDMQKILKTNFAMVKTRANLGLRTTSQ